LNTVPQSLKQLFHDSIDFQVNGGTMPPPDYLILHPEARLSDQEKKQIIQGLETTLSQ